MYEIWPFFLLFELAPNKNTVNYISQSSQLKADNPQCYYDNNSKKMLQTRAKHTFNINNQSDILYHICELDL